MLGYASMSSSWPEEDSVENPGIEIRGKRYQLPTLDTFTLNEERVLFLYADCVVRDFIPAHPDASDEDKEKFERLQILRFRNPDFKRGLAFVSLKRDDPGLEDDAAWELAGEANALEVDIAALWGDGPDPQTTSQKQPESTTPISEPSRSTDSGRSTMSGSVPVDVSLTSIGTSESDTSSPGAHPIASVS